MIRWSVALLDFATAKTEKRSVVKLGIATNHFISLTGSTLSQGVAPNKNMGLC
jgi:hypothetical protein